MGDCNENKHSAVNAPFEMANDIHLRVIEAVNEIYKQVILGLSGEVTANICLEKARELTGSQFGWIGKLNDGGLLDTIAMDNPGWRACRMPKTDAVRLFNNMALRGIWSVVLDTGQSLICNEPVQHPASVGVPKGHPPIQAFIGVPLLSDDKTVGMISLANKPGGYTAADQRALEALSVAIVAVLHRNEMDRIQGILKDLAAWLSVCPDLNAARRDVLEQIGLLQGIRCCALYQIAEDGLLHPVEFYGSDDCTSDTARRICIERALSDGLLQGESICVNRASLPDLIDGGPIPKTLENIVVLPLRIGGEVEAILLVGTVFESGIPRHIREALESIATIAGFAFSRLKAQQDLIEREDRFRLLFKESPVPIWEVNLSKVKMYIDEIRATGVSDIPAYFHQHPADAARCLLLTQSIDVNDVAQELFRATSKRGLLDNFGEIFCESTFASFIQMVAALASGRKTYQSETEFRTLIGRKIYTHAQWSVVEGYEADLSKVLFSAVDITARKRAEDVAWEANANLEKLFDSTADAICVMDCMCTISRVNKRFPFLDGRTRKEVVGLQCNEVLRLPICNTDQCHMKRLLAGEEYVEEDILVERDGRQIPFIISSTPIKDTAGEVMAMISVYKDISERKEMERQLMQSQKLESIGQLAAGIAHEINTPIQYVGDNLRFLQESFGEILNGLAQVEAGDVSANIKAALAAMDLDYLKEEVPSAVSQSLDGVTRVAEIVRAMKAFSHPGSENKTSTDINAALNTTITVSRNEWKYAAEIETAFDETLPQVPCYPGPLNQAFLNIIVNAAHAVAEKNKETGEKGRISVTTQQVNRWAEIRISDSGTGIPENIRAKIFDPFFTTKEVGKGTGQGLAMVHGIIVDKHGGEISVESTPGEGTTFILRLPLDGPLSSRPDQARMSNQP